MNFRGRVALITGASGGIGRATALRLAEAGADLALGYGHQEYAALAVVEQVRQRGSKAIAVGGISLTRYTSTPWLRRPRRGLVLSICSSATLELARLRNWKRSQWKNGIRR